MPCSIGAHRGARQAFEALRRRGAGRDRAAALARRSGARTRSDFHRRHAALGVDAVRTDPRHASRCRGRAANCRTWARSSRPESQRRRQPYPQWIAVGDRGRTGSDWGDYLSRTARWRVRRPRFTDKMPDNWKHAGILRAMLPAATVIDVRRDRVETAWSCFRQQFYQLPDFSADLADIATALRGCERAMDAWRMRDPRHIRLHRYEALLDRPRGQDSRAAGRLRVAIRRRLPGLPSQPAQRAHGERRAGAAAAACAIPRERICTARCWTPCARRWALVGRMPSSRHAIRAKCPHGRPAHRHHRRHHRQGVLRRQVGLPGRRAADRPHPRGTRRRVPVQRDPDHPQGFAAHRCRRPGTAARDHRRAADAARAGHAWHRHDGRDGARCWRASPTRRSC